MPLKFGAFPGWDIRFPATSVDIIDEPGAVISPIRRYLAPVYIDRLQDRYRKVDVITLSFTEYEMDWISIRIHSRMDFCTGTATAMSYPVWRPPFFAPALC